MAASGEEAPDPSLVQTRGELGAALKRLNGSDGANGVREVEKEAQKRRVPLSRSTAGKMFNGEMTPGTLHTFLQLRGVPDEAVPEWDAALKRANEHATSAPTRGRPPASPESTRQSIMRPRAAVLAAFAVLAVAGVVVYERHSGASSPSVSMRVVTRGLILTPSLVVGNYATRVPIGQVPPPPGDSNSCFGRADWAHRAPINGIDDGFSVAKVDISALGGEVEVDRAELHIDATLSARPPFSVLGCGGRGGQDPPELVQVDLDTGSYSFDEKGDGTPSALNLFVANGETTSILVLGTAEKAAVKWRLEITARVAGQDQVFTVGPDGAQRGNAAANPHQESFQTVGSLVGTPYTYLSGAWRTGR